MNKNDKIFISGHNGMVGSSFLKKLKKLQFKKIIYETKKNLDLRDQKKVQQYFKKNKIDVLIICSAKVGGIMANNTYPYDFIRDNLLMQTNLIDNALKYSVKKVLFLGSSCIYPKESKQPIKEESLLSGHLEKTNEQYSIAKLSGIKLCEGIMRQYGKQKNIDFRTIIPPNLFGDNDNYDDNNSHVIASLIKKIKNAKMKNAEKIVIWGDGKPKREFLHVDDLVDYSIQILKINKNNFWKNFDCKNSHLNIGSGYEISIVDLAKIIFKIVNYYPKIEFDKTMPNGVSRKIMSNTKVRKILKNYKPYDKSSFYQKIKITAKNY